MPFNSFGIPLFYPPKTGGFYYEQSADILDDSEFDGTGGDVTNSGGGQWTFNVNGSTSVHLLKDPGFSDSIGGCNMDFEATAIRGYGNKPDDVRDLMVTMIVKFNSDLGAEGLSISGPTGHHTGSDCCQGFAYMINAQYGVNPAVFRFRKEMKHVDYYTDPVTGEWTHPLVNFMLKGHDEVGYGYVRYNKKDGISPGKDSVIVECWFNPDPANDITNWVMLKRTEDKGGWGHGGGTCNGNDDQVGTWGNGKIIRIKANDSGSFDIKHLSVIEIDPTKSFDDDQGSPPPDSGSPGATEEVKGFYKLYSDINVIRVSPCAGTGGGGGGGGSAVFYEVATQNDKELSDSSTFQHRTGVVEQLENASGIMFGNTLHQLDVPLKKVGSPGASPVVTASILDSAGNIIYTSPTTFDPSTFTTSYVEKTFDFSGNTHAFVVGDCVGVFYTGTSSSNYVKCSYWDSNIIANCVYNNFESGSLDPKSGRDFSCRMWN